MTISGVRVSKKNGCNLFHIDDLSTEFKDEIRKQLTGVFHGFAHIEDVPHLSYKYTVKEFLKRFKDKAVSTKKGMIGELLAHILLNRYLRGWKTLSILKNKEEASIKKGFDIIYIEVKHSSIWYTEVKSGRNALKYSSDDYNAKLLNRSKTSLSNMFKSKRNTLWESALADVDLVIKSKKKKTDLKNLLFTDGPVLAAKKTKRNAILISVLYHNLADEVSINTLKTFLDQVVIEKRFNNLIIVSIQKATFEKVVKFLKEEAK